MKGYETYGKKGLNLTGIVAINVNAEIKDYLQKLKAKPDNSLRSWDHCRRVFRRAAYQRNPGSTCLPTLPECKCDICGNDCKGINCHLCDNSLALNLAFYLASWGMYRSSFLKKYDYTIHIEAVKTSWDKCGLYTPMKIIDMIFWV